MATASLSVCIDASTRDAADLLPIVFQLLYATQPDRHGIASVTLFVGSDDRTDWPDVAWLKVIHAEGPAKYAKLNSGTSSRDIEEYLHTHPDNILVSLNSPSVAHPTSLVIVSDFAASQFNASEESGGFLKRIRRKIDVKTRHRELENTRGVVVFSCYAIAQISVAEKSLVQKLNTLPLGIDPMFFGPQKDHRMIRDLTITDPYVWLSALTHDSSDAIVSVIEAIKPLRALGSFATLKLFIPDSVGGHKLHEDTRKHAEALAAEHDFVNVINDCSPSEMVRHYRHSDGFVWGQRSDRNYHYVLYAMASGMPIIAASSEMIKKHLGPNIRYFRVDDSNDLANTLERSMSDIHFRIIGGGLNHKRSMYYTWEKSAAEFFGLIRAYGNKPTESEALAS